MIDPIYVIKCGDIDTIESGDNELHAIHRALTHYFVVNGLPKLDRHVRIMDIATGREEMFITLPQVTNPAFVKTAFATMFEEGLRPAPPKPKRVPPPLPPPPVGMSAQQLLYFIRQRKPGSRR